MNENSKMEKLINLAEKISAPLVRFSNIPFITAIQEAMTANVPLIIVGSLFFLLSILGKPVIGTSMDAEPLLPFLAPIASGLGLVFDYTVGLYTLLTIINVAIAYGRQLKLEEKSCAILSISAYIILTCKSAEEIPNSFSIYGLFIGLLCTYVCLRIYHWFIKRNIVIKMPAQVPPAVSVAFSSLIPMAAILVISWFIGQALQIDVLNIFSNLLTQFVSAADSIWAYTGIYTVSYALWSVGLHGSNILAAIINPIEQANIILNSEAALAGTPIMELPHIWAGTFNYLTCLPGTAWPIIFLMITSKVKAFKELGKAISVPSLIIIEPVIFGIPIAFNPYLMLPFVLTAAVGCFVSYGIFMLDLVQPFYIQVPWATPAFIMAPVCSGGDMRTLLVIALNFLIGLVFYYPFFKAYERNELEKEQKNLELEQAQEQAQVLEK